MMQCFSRRCAFSAVVVANLSAHTLQWPPSESTLLKSQQNGLRITSTCSMPSAVASAKGCEPRKLRSTLVSNAVHCFQSSVPGVNMCRSEVLWVYQAAMSSHTLLSSLRSSRSCRAIGVEYSSQIHLPSWSLEIPLFDSPLVVPKTAAKTAPCSVGNRAHC